MPLLLRITLAALAIFGVFREVLFMLFLLRDNLGVTVTEGSWSATASTATGDGVLMRDTEKRPCTVGVCPLALGVSTCFLEGDFPLAGDGEAFLALDFLGDGVLFFAGLCTFGLSGFSCSNSYKNKIHFK